MENIEIKKLEVPKIKVNASLIIDIAMGASKTYILQTAVQMDVFTHLQQSQTAKEVAETQGTHERLTEKFLNALVAMELLEKSEDRYKLTSIARTYLLPSSPVNLIGLVQSFSSDTEPGLKNLLDFLKKGPNPMEEGTYKMDKEMLKFTGKYALGGEIQDALEIVTKLPEFKTAKRMLDIGGGHGYFSLAFCEHNPDLKAVVNDLPDITELTREIIAEYGMEDRVEIMDGDFSTTHSGAGYDLVLASHVLYWWFRNLPEIFKKIYEALNPGGVFISNYYAIAQDGTSPLNLVIVELDTATVGLTNTFSDNKLVDSLELTGFADIIVRPGTRAPMNNTFIIAKKKEQELSQF